MAEISPSKMPNMFDMVRDRMAQHIDLGIIEHHGEEFFAETFTFEGETHKIMVPRALILQCADPSRTRGRLMEIWIEGLTGLTSTLNDVLRKAGQ